MWPSLLPSLLWEDPLSVYLLVPKGSRWALSCQSINANSCYLADWSNPSDTLTFSVHSAVLRILCNGYARPSSYPYLLRKILLAFTY